MKMHHMAHLTKHQQIQQILCQEAIDLVKAVLCIKSNQNLRTSLLQRFLQSDQVFIIWMQKKRGGKVVQD